MAIKVILEVIVVLFANTPLLRSHTLSVMGLLPVPVGRRPLVRSVLNLNLSMRRAFWGAGTLMLFSPMSEGFTHASSSASYNEHSISTWFCSQCIQPLRSVAVSNARADRGLELASRLVRPGHIGSFRFCDLSSVLWSLG